MAVFVIVLISDSSKHRLNHSKKEFSIFELFDKQEMSVSNRQKNNEIMGYLKQTKYKERPNSSRVQSKQPSTRNQIFENFGRIQRLTLPRKMFFERKGPQELQGTSKTLSFVERAV